MPEIQGSSLAQSNLQLRPPLPFGHLSARFTDGLEKGKISRKKSNEAEDCEVEFLGSYQQGNRATIDGLTPPPLSSVGDKCQKKLKAPKSKGCLPQNLESADGSNSAANNCRYDSSLGLLTKKFLNLLQHAEDGTLDLNKAVEILDVQKRRIYDITNVLEGVGLIEKKLKNMIRWKGTDISRPKEMNNHIIGLKAEIETLYADECRVDETIREMHDTLRAMTEDERNHKWLFVTKEDINSLTCFKNATIISIKAPHGTSVEVPDPDEGLDFPQRHYQMFLRSSMGPINCYLLSEHEERLNGSTSKEQREAMDLLAVNKCNSGRDGTSSQQSTSQDNVCEKFAGAVKIVPSDVDMDADYLLLSESRISVMESWIE